MALEDVIGTLEWPSYDDQFFNLNNPGSSAQLNAANDWMGFLLIAPKTGTLDRIWFNPSAVVTAEDLHISFQNISATTGDPDGTIDEFRVVASGSLTATTFVDSGLITSDGTDVGTKRTVTRGDKLAVVIKFNSTVGDVSILGGNPHSSGGEDSPGRLFTSDAGTTWVHFHEHVNGMVLEYETSGIHPITAGRPAVALITKSVHTGTTPDELGFKFQVPMEMVISGVYCSGPTLDVSVGIENAAGGTIAAEVTAPIADDGTSFVKRFYPFPNWVTLEADTIYYVTWRPTSGATKQIRSWDVDASIIRGGWAFGIDHLLAERTDDGAWTENTDEVIPFALKVEQIEGNSGGAPPTCDFGGLANGTRVIPVAGT